ncbi:hypothetical protein ABXL43_34515, partial [Burkholderia sola]
MQSVGLYPGPAVHHTVSEAAGEVAERVGQAASGMDMAGLLALAAALGWASGFRLYAVVFVTGLLGALGWVFARWAKSPKGRQTWQSWLLGLPGLALSGAPTVATLFGLGGATMAFFSRTWGDEPSPAPREARIWTALWLGVTLLAAALSWWLDQWAWRLVDSGTAKEWQSLVRMLLWFGWPAWPLALWTLWVWRRQIAAPRRYPHLALPLWFAI